MLKQVLKHWHPSFWIQLNRYDEDWDRFITQAIKHDASVQLISAFTITINGYYLWIGNYPYGFGTTEPINEPKFRYNVRPSRKTIYKLDKHIQRKLAQKSNEQYQYYLQASSDKGVPPFSVQYFDHKENQ